MKLYLGNAIGAFIATVLTMETVAAQPARPGEQCATAPIETWEEPERWAWNEICEGRVADFDQKWSNSERLDAKSPNGWDDGRRLSQNFLEIILLHEPFRSAIPRHGVQIEGAWFPEKIELRNAQIDHLLRLGNSRFEQGLDLTGARFQSRLELSGSSISGELSMWAVQATGLVGMLRADLDTVILRDAELGGPLNLHGATVSGLLNMDKLEVGSSLFMRQGAEFAEVNLRGAKVTGQLDFSRALVSGRLTMDALKVGSSLLMHESTFDDVLLIEAEVGSQLDLSHAKVTGFLDMRNIDVGSGIDMDRAAEFNDVFLRWARVGDQIDMTNAKVSGRLDLGNADVGGSLYLRGEDAAFSEVILRGARVGGQLSMIAAEFSGELNMGGLDVSGNLFMSKGAIFAKHVNLSYANIGSNLDLSGAQFVTLSLAGSRLGELRLGSAEHEPTQWPEGGGGLLILQNTIAEAVQDRLEPDPWPPRLVLDGFTYRRLGGSTAAKAEVDMASRPVSWFTDWLAKDQDYSRQPYRHLADLLRAAGDDGMANSIIYASRERLREQSEGRTWLGLTVLKYTIGYGLGYRYFWSIFWVAAFVVIGAVVLRVSRTKTTSVFWALFCSFDLLLPIVKLDPQHREDVKEMGGLGMYYFYFHQLAGWVLASFIGAGLAGLTQL